MIIRELGFNSDESYVEGADRKISCRFVSQFRLASFECHYNR